MIKLPDETEMKWRDLALQFDGHRMQAISLLKMIIKDASDDQYLSVRNFLKSGPLPGEEVLRNRIAEIAEVQRLNATAQPKCQKCGDAGMADSGGTQPWGEQILIECDCATAQPVSDGCKVPEGWKLVPIEATEEMLIDGFESEPDEGFSEEAEWEKYQSMSGCEQAKHRARLCWNAMLAAAPGGQGD